MNNQKTKTFELYGVNYTIRKATKGELEQALRFSIDEEAEDFLVNTCLISPKIDLNSVYAGIPRKLALEILEFSDASQEASSRLQEEADKRVLTPMGKVEALMMGILHLKQHEINNMTNEEWYRAAAAAQLLSVALYPGFDLQRYMDFGTENESKHKKDPVKDFLNKLPPVARR